MFSFPHKDKANRRYFEVHIPDAAFLKLPSKLGPGDESESFFCMPECINGSYYKSDYGMHHILEKEKEKH